MDSIKCQKLQPGIKFEKAQLLKKTLQLLMLSLFCVFLVLLSPSATFSLLDLSFKLYFSTLSFQRFDYSIDRNYMFLLCNGILVLLAMTSGLISFCPVETVESHDESRRSNRDYLQRVDEIPEKKASASGKVTVSKSINNPENAQGGGGKARLITVEDENGYLVAVGREGGFSPAAPAVPVTALAPATSPAAVPATAAEDHEEEEEANEAISTEELNKKCEEFIRKMKQGLKSEARQLVMVQNY